MRWESTSSQAGARVIGSIRPDSRHGRHVQDAPPPRSRLWSLQQEIGDPLEATLREETGADPADALPGLITGQIAWIRHTVFVSVGCEMVSRCKPDEVSREVLVLLDDIEELLGDRVVNYAVRGEQ
ncbi:hypothetical protein AQJ84_14275 [Streptomyces resistomycificus]|nr:hypothetical protein AQJ84_14275 [Streptomyces resistomycificus]